jgi:ABC-2 type transport system ATP-binding protein
MPAIELDGVSKRFGDVVAVHDLDLTIAEGAVFGFLGPNGAGKSTTINMLLDFVRPTTGEIHVLGRDARTEIVAVRAKTGVLPEGFDVYDRLTGRQHVAFAIDSKNADDDVDAILDRVGLTDASTRRAGGYSSGMRQRLALCIALVGSPDLLILDEPSTGLDPNGAREMRAIVREENRRGATVFFSSHILGQVEAVCDRVGIMNNGRMVVEDTIEGLRDEVGSDTQLTVQVGGQPNGVAGQLRELDAVTVARATYVPDLRARVTRDAGAFIHALEAGTIDADHVHAELGEVVTGAVPGRTSDDEITVFDSGGTAIETVAAAHLLYERAAERGLGTPIEFAPASEAMPGGGE